MSICNSVQIQRKHFLDFDIGGSEMNLAIKGRFNKGECVAIDGGVQNRATEFIRVRAYIRAAAGKT